MKKFSKQVALLMIDRIIQTQYGMTNIPSQAQNDRSNLLPDLKDGFQNFIEDSEFSFF